MASLAFDFRAHGATGGPQEQMTLTGLINDIVASIKFIQSRASVQRFSLIAASFSGGVATYVAAKFREVSSVVLLNPRLNYLPWIAEPKFWLDGRFDADAAKKLHKFGYLKRNGFPSSEHALPKDSSGVLHSVINAKFTKDEVQTIVEKAGQGNRRYDYLPRIVFRIQYPESGFNNLGARPDADFYTTKKTLIRKLLQNS